MVQPQEYAYADRVSLPVSRHKQRVLSLAERQVINRGLGRMCCNYRIPVAVPLNIIGDLSGRTR